MSDLKGYAGQLLDVDLTTGTTTTVPLDPQLVRDFVGGRALGIRMIMEEYGENYADIDPLGEEAILALMTGPYSCFGAGKNVACFKSPLNGGMFGSASSGDWNSGLKFAGYDGVIVRGKASKPVYLFIDNDTVEIREAQHLWGLDVAETHKFLDKELPSKSEYLYIGPGGENLVKFAAIITNWYRACGRGGSGAVMGSKNLKAIAVHGTGPAPEPADMDAVYGFMNEMADVGMQYETWREWGTAKDPYPAGHDMSCTPVKNWQGEYHDHYEVRQEFFAAEHWIRRHWGDYGCTACCSKLGRVKSGDFAGSICELPDYEGAAYCGSNLDIWDINAITYLADLHDKLGLDVIEGGGVLSFATELVEKGILSQEDFNLGEDAEGNPLELTWGNAKAYEALLYQIVKREGIGDTLANGAYQAALAIGEEAMPSAVVSKGIILGAHGVRSKLDFITHGNPVGYPLETHGGDHGSLAGTADQVTEGNMDSDSFGLCQFWYMPAEHLTDNGAERKIEWLNAITGFDITMEEVKETLVPRWINVQRAALLLAGWTAEDDVNPDRWYEPLPDGPCAGMTIDKAEEQQLMKQAYQVRGWDANGIPTTETLEKYGIGFLDAALAKLR